MTKDGIEFSLQKKLHSTNGELFLDVKAKIQKGNFVSIYGASGAGKTSILKMLAGLMKPEMGKINVCDQVWLDTSATCEVPIQQRSIGIVFQDFALFPNMTVQENIAFALSKNDSRDIVEELIELIGLENLRARNTQTLSGGQKQRVALARALARRPKLLLLDEPLSAIDHDSRLELQNLIAQLHKRYALTTILVSHNKEEIIRLSDWVYPLENGVFQVEQSPATYFIDTPPDAKILGTIISTTSKEATVLIENRMLQIPMPEKKLKVKDHIKLDFNTELIDIKQL